MEFKLELVRKYWWVGVLVGVWVLVLFDMDQSRREREDAAAYAVVAAMDDAAASATAADPSELVDGDAAASATAEIRGGETYQEFDGRRDDLEGSRGSFGGYGCTVDCGGHSAGYDWAAQRGIEDPDECGGNSWSFEEGCRAYAEEQQSERSNYDDGEGESY